jgi:hypothetical protein
MSTNDRAQKIRMAFKQSLDDGRAMLQVDNFEQAWPALERAHVLGQGDPWLHLQIHWWMLRCGWKERDSHEVIGQLLRLALAAPSSWLGRYPKGNTGRARVGLFQPMKIAPETRTILGE